MLKLHLLWLQHEREIRVLRNPVVQSITTITWTRYRNGSNRIPTIFVFQYSVAVGETLRRVPKNGLNALLVLYFPNASRSPAVVKPPLCWEDRTLNGGETQRRRYSCLDKFAVVLPSYIQLEVNQDAEIWCM